jgi:hypothetical protein
MAKLKSLKQRMADGDMPPPAEFNTEEECVSYYEGGGEGCIYDPDGAEECEAQEDGVFGDAAQKYGIADSGKGKLSLLYPGVWKVSGREEWFQGKISQCTGDCVSRSQSHSAISTLAHAVLNGNGSWPDIPDESYRSGMPWSPTATYWLKHSGVSGWSCAAAARESKKIGLVIAKHYDNPSIGDLLKPENYKTSTIAKYCHRGPPEDAFKDLNYCVTQTYSRSNTSKFEEIRDALANGYGVSTCGGQGYSRSRDAHGVAKRSGHWSHALSLIGCDSTEWAIKNYGEPLYLVLNSWGHYMGKDRPHPQGNTSIPGIPAGSFWCTVSSFSGRDSYIFSSVKGFPPQKLPDWNLGGPGGLI